MCKLIRRFPTEELQSAAKFPVLTRWPRGRFCLYLLLVLTVWMANFARVRADGTRPNTEIGRTENVSDTSLCPVASSGDIAVVELCPEENLLRGIGVFRELFFGQFKRSGVMAKTIIVGKNNESSSTARPFFRLLGNDSDRNNLWFNVHYSDVEGGSLPYVVDEETHPELFSYIGFSVCPCGCGTLSSLNNVLVVTQPSSLIQTYRIHSGIGLFFHSDNLPCSRLSTSSGRRSSLFGSVRSSLSSSGLFLHFPQSGGELLGILSECISGRHQPFSGQLNLLPSTLGIEESHYYKRDGRTSHEPLWPLFLGLLVALGIQAFGGLLVFLPLCGLRPFNRRKMLLGVFLIVVGWIGGHHVLPQLDERLWEMRKRPETVSRSLPDKVNSSRVG